MGKSLEADNHKVFFHEDGDERFRYGRLLVLIESLNGSLTVDVRDYLEGIYE